MQYQNLAWLAALAWPLASGARADFTNDVVPPFRGDPGSEYAQWDSFAHPVADPNFPDHPSTTNLDAQLVQTDPTAFLAGGNIYSFSAPVKFELADGTPGPLREVYLQTATKGEELDYANIRLVYLDSLGLAQSLPWDTHTELAFTPSQGVDVESLFTWDLTGLGESIVDFTITFEAVLPSTSLDALILDTLSVEPPQTYCTALVNSSGCTPTMTFSGLPSASEAAVFDVGAAEVLPAKPGLLTYSTGNSAAIPFGGGILCALPPLRRTPLQLSSSMGGVCGGTYTFDFNTRIQSGIDPLLVAGQQVWSQYWSRDTLAVAGIGLTNGLTFLIQP